MRNSVISQVTIEGNMKSILFALLILCSAASVVSINSVDVASLNPYHRKWFTEHGSLEGCCGCDCHCGDCPSPYGPCSDPPCLEASSDETAVSTTKSVDVASLNPYHRKWFTEHGSLEGCCGCDCHCGDCPSPYSPCSDPPCLEVSSDETTTPMSVIKPAKNNNKVDVASLNPYHRKWFTEHGSLEGCCGCDCHCGDCPPSSQEITSSSDSNKPSKKIEIAKLNPHHRKWFLEHGSLDACCGCDCHCGGCLKTKPRRLADFE